MNYRFLRGGGITQQILLSRSLSDCQMVTEVVVAALAVVVRGKASLPPPTVGPVQVEKDKERKRGCVIK